MGLFVGLGVGLAAPKTYRQSERANREVAERGGSAQPTHSGVTKWTPVGMPGQRFRHQYRGYKIDEVDAFFARIESRGVTAKEIEEVTFRLSWRRGYDLREVDEALDQAKVGAPPE